MSRSSARTAPLILLVVNPRRRRGPDTARRAAAMLRTGGLRTETVRTAPEDGTDRSGVVWGASLQRRLSRADAEGEAVAAVVAVGGDGMVHTVVNVLRQRSDRGLEPVPFGLVPAGTGNDLARHMGVPQNDPERAAGRVLRGLDEGPRSMDLGRIELADDTRRWYATAACCGIDAAVAQRANSWRWPRGESRYLAALPVEVLRYPSPFTSLEIEQPGGRTVLSARRLLMLSVANTSSIGGGLRIVPHAEAFDGVLEIFQVRAMPRTRIARLFPLLMRAAHTELPEVSMDAALSARIDATGPIYADGEPVGSGPAVISIEPAALPALL